jgi:hypothetical protein
MYAKAVQFTTGDGMVPEASIPDGGIEITDGLGYFVGNFKVLSNAAVL